MKVLTIFFIILFASGCKYQKELDKLDSLELDRIYLENEANTGLDAVKQEAIKKYFSNVKNLAHRLQNDNRFSRDFHRNYFAYFSDDLCSKYILDIKSWKNILNSCEVSGFFLCAEEAKYYQEILQLVRLELTDLEVESLMENSACKEKLSELEVINE